MHCTVLGLVLGLGLLIILNCLELIYVTCLIGSNFKLMIEQNPAGTYLFKYKSENTRGMC